MCRFGRSHFIENYSRISDQRIGGNGLPNYSHMALNSVIMAVVITVGKIAISILSAFAIVYFRFPFRVLAFWIIFVTLMLPVEVRIMPTYKIVADLGMLNSGRADSAADCVCDGHLPVSPCSS